MSQASLLSSANSNPITFPITVPQGGTGQTTLPAHTVLIGEGTSAIGTAGPGAANSILMGQGSGADPVFGTLVAGSNITITPGATTLTISASGGSSGSIVFTDDSGTTATTDAGTLNLFGDSASGSSVLGNGAKTITVSNLTASTSQKGVLSIATNAEAIAGSDTGKAITADDLKAKLGAQTTNGIPFGQGQSSALSWTVQGAANTVLLGNGGVPTFGVVPNAALQNSSVTLNSGNNITVTGGGPLSLGGVASFNVTGTTNHGVQVGTATGALNSLAVGNSGQVLIGSSGSDPQFGNLTSSDGSITFTTGAGTLGLTVTGGITTGKTITGDAGGALSPTAGNWNIFGTSAQGISTSGAGSTLTLTNADWTTAQKGVGVLSTNAQSIAGSGTTQAVTPASLGAKLGTQTSNGVAYGNGTTGAINWTAAGSTGQVLIGNTGSAPTWGTAPTPALTITGDDSVTLSPTANNWNIDGQQAGTVPVMITHGSVSTLAIEDRTWVSQYVVDPSATVGLRGTFTTIQSAVNAASSGQTIYVRPGTYTENVTLAAGVNICALGTGSNQFNGSGNVKIVGKLSYTGLGTVNLYGLTLETNGDYILSVTGTNASIVNINNCDLRVTNSTGIQYTTANTSSQINIWHSTIVQTADNISYFTHSSTGILYFYHNHLQYDKPMTNSKSTCSAGTFSMDHCVANFAMTSSGTSSLNITHCYIDSSNQVAFTVGGSGANLMFTSIVSGSAIGVTANVATTIYKCAIISSSATAAISGSSIVNANDIYLGGSAVKITATRSSYALVLGAAHGTTGGIANNATSSFFTATTRSMYIASCQGNGAVGVRASAFVSYDGAGTLTADSIASSGCNIAVSGSSIQIHNTAGGTISFNWSVQRMY